MALRPSDTTSNPATASPPLSKNKTVPGATALSSLLSAQESSLRSLQSAFWPAAAVAASRAESETEPIPFDQTALDQKALPKNFNGQQSDLHEPLNSRASSFSGHLNEVVRSLLLSTPSLDRGSGSTPIATAAHQSKGVSSGLEGADEARRLAHVGLAGLNPIDLLPGAGSTPAPPALSRSPSGADLASGLESDPATIAGSRGRPTPLAGDRGQGGGIDPTGDDEASAVLAAMSSHLDLLETRLGRAISLIDQAADRLSEISPRPGPISSRTFRGRVGD
jgi:hypothetical protein